MILIILKLVKYAKNMFFTSYNFKVCISVTIETYYVKYIILVNIKLYKFIIFILRYHVYCMPWNNILELENNYRILW